MLKLMPHVYDVDEDHEALTIPSQLISCYSSKLTKSSMQLIKHSGTTLIEMKIIRNRRCNPDKVHKWNATQGFLELIKALSPIK